MAVKHLVADEEMFLANYSDGLPDTAAGTVLTLARRSDRGPVRHSVAVSGLSRFTRETLYATMYFAAARHLPARGFLAVHGHAARQAGA